MWRFIHQGISGSAGLRKCILPARCHKYFICRGLCFWGPMFGPHLLLFQGEVWLPFQPEMGEKVKADPPPRLDEDLRDQGDCAEVHPTVGPGDSESLEIRSKNSWFLLIVMRQRV